MIARSHYERQTLQQFLDDTLGEQTEQVADHLDHCPQCQDLVESMMREGLTIEEAGQLLRPDSSSGHQGGDDPSVILSAAAAGVLEATDHPAMAKILRHRWNRCCFWRWLPN